MAECIGAIVDIVKNRPECSQIIKIQIDRMMKENIDLIDDLLPSIKQVCAMFLNHNIRINLMDKPLSIFIKKI